MEVTRYGPCHGLESFLFFPVNSCGKRTNTQLPILNEVGLAFLSNCLLYFLCAACILLAANSRAEDSDTTNSCR